MSLTGFAERTEPPSGAISATSEFPEIVIAPDILELLSSAMYVDPITIYREYVQNAADAIDEARASGILKPDQPGRVDIAMDAQARSVCIRDNGCGIASETFCRRLLALGGSEKRGTSARGFRGVGRLAGLGYAREVIFRASAAGETITSELRWDCRRLKAALLAADNVLSAADVIRWVTSYEQHDGADTDEHFFEVELKGVVRLTKDQLISPPAVSAYLSQVAPVPFAPNFRFGAKIATALSKHMNRGTLLIHVDEAAEPLYRPHRDQIDCGHERQVAFESIDVVELPGIDGNVAAVGWVLHHQYEGALPASTMVKGLRLRCGNIQVGGHLLLEDLFPETRFNGWTVGEVHVLDSRIVPNGRRDHFEQNGHYNNLLNHLLPTARTITQNCRTSSVRRKWEREFDIHARAIEEKLAIIGQGSIGKGERNQIALEVEKTFLKLSKINEMKILAEHTEERSVRIASLRANLSSSLGEETVSASPLARLPDGKREAYERFFELIYECSTNRLAAKALIDRILMRIN